MSVINSVRMHRRESDGPPADDDATSPSLPSPSTEHPDDDVVAISSTSPPADAKATASEATTSDATSLQREHTREIIASSTFEVHALCRNHVSATFSPSSLSIMFPTFALFARLLALFGFSDPRGTLSYEYYYGWCSYTRHKSYVGIFPRQLPVSSLPRPGFGNDEDIFSLDSG